MKIIFLSLFLFLAISCNKHTHNEAPYMDLAVVNDITDHHILRPEANPILQLYNLSEHKNSRVNFTYAEITDLMLSKEATINLPDETFTDKKNIKREPMYREKIIVQFYDSVRKMLHINNTIADTITKGNSECLRIIAKQLTELIESKSANKMLLVFSNLFEHSNILNVYAQDIKNSRFKPSDEVEKIFEKTKLLPDNLKGITVVFVYAPESRQDDERYNILVNAYKDLLINRGAIVFVQANNNSYPL